MNNQTYLNNFNYKGENKLIVYDANNKEVDISKIKKISKNYVINDFYRSTYNSNFMLNDNMILQLNYESFPYKFDLDGGKDALEDNEVVLLLPKNQFEGNDFLNQEILINQSLNKYTVVGFQYRDDISSINATHNKIIENEILMKSILGNDVYLSYEDEIGIYQNFGVNIVFDNDLDESYIALNSDYTKTKLKVKDSNIVYSSIYEFDFNFSNLEIKETNLESEIIIGKDFIKAINERPYEVAIYPDNKAIAESELKNFGYSFVSVKNFDTSSPMQSFINNALSYLMILLSSLTIVIVYFVSYLILSKIYSSRKKDYTILRTLGISKKDMKNVVVYEVMSLTIFISIFSYLIMLIASKITNKGIMVIFSNISIFCSIFYFGVMLVFGYMIARRFNRKLFKFSVSKTFKGSENKHD